MKNKELSLGDRMKQYESKYEHTIPNDEHIIVRIDGHHFSKYTKNMTKPFDNIFSNAMEETSKDLLEEFQAVTVYTQSDEITLVIPSLKDITKDKRKSTKHKLDKKIREDWTHIYSGRIQKMSSLIAAFATMSFNKHFTKLVQNNDADGMNDTYHWRMSEKLGNAWFDCRVYGVKTAEEVFNSILFRARDAEKNSISMYTGTFCSHKQLHGLNGKEKIELCYNNYDKNWHDIENKFKYGLFIKKEQYQKEVNIEPNKYNDFYGTKEYVTRTRLVSYSEKLIYSDENVKKIMKKFLVVPVVPIKSRSKVSELIQTEYKILDCIGTDSNICQINFEK